MFKNRHHQSDYERGHSAGYAAGFQDGYVQGRMSAQQEAKEQEDPPSPSVRTLTGEELHGHAEARMDDASEGEDGWSGGDAA